MKLTTFLVSATLVHFTNAVNGLFGTGFYKNKGFEIDAGSFTEKSSNLRFVETKWITQRLNNFNPQDNRTWEMRYMENNHYLQDGGPIFIYVGGEWTISSMWLRTGHMHDMARDLNGTMLNTEHRYYGESRPTPDLTTENLVFLTDDQALADLAHFIVEIKNTIPEVRNSGVILVGASYSATMATWFLQKYPHLANGAWSSSAPLNAKLDFKEYMETVSESIEQVGGKSCARRIQEAFKSLEQMIASKNVSRIEKLFLFCKPFNLTAELDVWSFFSTVSGIISGVVQYHKRAHQNIQKMCSQLVDINIVNDVDALANWFRKQNDGSCIDYRYESSLEISKVEWGANYEYMRQWYYQTCAEFGWFQSSGANNSMFGSSFPVNLYVQQCKDAFGENLTKEIIQENVDHTNVIYGSLNPNVRNVYSTHGQLDPWHKMGVLKDINEFSPTVILPLESHCSDMHSLLDTDSPEIKASKKRIFELVKQWLGMSLTTKVD